MFSSPGSPRSSASRPPPLGSDAGGGPGLRRFQRRDVGFGVQGLGCRGVQLDLRYGVGIEGWGFRYNTYWDSESGFMIEGRGSEP